jgi:RimJ/RimL family protein N-acetyltransferase
MNSDDIVIRTILYNDGIVGHIAKFVMFDKPELTYWIDRDYWGKGTATQSLIIFLSELHIRPIFARAAKDNYGSIRVLEKCGFELIGNEKGLANARGKEIDEVVMRLD